VSNIGPLDIIICRYIPTPKTTQSSKFDRQTSQPCLKKLPPAEKSSLYLLAATKNVPWNTTNSVRMSFRAVDKYINHLTQRRHENFCHALDSIISLTKWRGAGCCSRFCCWWYATRRPRRTTYDVVQVMRRRRFDVVPRREIRRMPVLAIWNMLEVFKKHARAQHLH